MVAIPKEHRVVDAPPKKAAQAREQKSEILHTWCVGLAGQTECYAGDKGSKQKTE